MVARDGRKLKKALSVAAGGTLGFVGGNIPGAVEGAYMGAGLADMADLYSRTRYRCAPQPVVHPSYAQEQPPQKGPPPKRSNKWKKALGIAAGIAGAAALAYGGSKLYKHIDANTLKNIADWKGKTTRSPVDGQMKPDGPMPTRLSTVKEMMGIGGPPTIPKGKTREQFENEQLTKDVGPSRWGRAKNQLALTGANVRNRFSRRPAADANTLWEIPMEEVDQEVEPASRLRADMASFAPGERAPTLLRVPPTKEARRRAYVTPSEIIPKRVFPLPAIDETDGFHTPTEDGFFTPTGSAASTPRASVVQRV